jgi:hypothetical protein
MSNYIISPTMKIINKKIEFEPVSKLIIGHLNLFKAT